MCVTNWYWAAPTGSAHVLKDCISLKTVYHCCPSPLDRVVCLFCTYEVQCVPICSL
jgi:hypothetical protein